MTITQTQEQVEQAPATQTASKTKKKGKTTPKVKARTKAKMKPKAKIDPTAPLIDHGDRTFRVFNLSETDREAVQQLGRSEDRPRWQVLEALIPIISNMDVGSAAKVETRALRLDMPKSTLKALRIKSDKTGVPMTRLLVMAAQAYHGGNQGELGKRVLTVDSPKGKRGRRSATERKGKGKGKRGK